MYILISVYSKTGIVTLLVFITRINIEVMEQPPCRYVCSGSQVVYCLVKAYHIVERHQVKVRGVAIPIGLTYRSSFRLSMGF